VLLLLMGHVSRQPRGRVGALLGNVLLHLHHLLHGNLLLLFLLRDACLLHLETRALLRLLHAGMELRSLFV
jgi:hypothetical protein